MIKLPGFVVHMYYLSKSLNNTTLEPHHSIFSRHSFKIQMFSFAKCFWLYAQICCIMGKIWNFENILFRIFHLDTVNLGIIKVYLHFLKWNGVCKLADCNMLLLAPLRWRHNDHAGISNHQPHGCLLNRLFRRKSKKTSKLRVTGQLRGKCFHLMTSSCCNGEGRHTFKPLL